MFPTIKWFTYPEIQLYRQSIWERRCPNGTPLYFECFEKYLKIKPCWRIINLAYFTFSREGSNNLPIFDIFADHLAAKKISNFITCTTWVYKCLYKQFGQVLYTEHIHVLWQTEYVIYHSLYVRSAFPFRRIWKCSTENLDVIIGVVFEISLTGLRCKGWLGIIWFQFTTLYICSMVFETSLTGLKGWIFDSNLQHYIHYTYLLMDSYWSTIWNVIASNWVYGTLHG